jgi:hypothetical protein
MPINSSAKGKAFERKACKMLTESLGVPFTRNWMTQSAIGGFDLVGLDQLAIEVKADKSLSVKACWEQTVKQAKAASKIPVLIRKLNLQPWEFYLPLYCLTNFKECDGMKALFLDKCYCGHEYIAKITLDSFKLWVKISDIKNK